MRQRTYSELALESRQAANMLRRAGVGAGDIVIAVLGTSYEWWVLSLALMRLNAVISPGTTQLTGGDLAKRFAASRASAFVTSIEYMSTADSVDALVASGHAPALRLRLLVDPSENARPGWACYHRGMQQADTAFEDLTTRARDTMCLYFTSGTTGMPKMTVPARQSLRGQTSA